MRLILPLTDRGGNQISLEGSDDSDTVGQILTFIAKTFNPALCVGVRHEINLGNFDAWAKQHCPDGWRSGSRRTLDQFGNIIERQRSRSMADWEFVSLFLSIAEYGKRPAEHVAHS